MSITNVKKGLVKHDGRYIVEHNRVNLVEHRDS